MNLIQNIDLKVVETEKFKDITVYIDFRLPYVDDDYLAYFILSDLLGEYSDCFPDKLSMTKMKDLLYGITVEGSAEVFRNNLHFSLIYRFLDPSFVADVTLKDDLDFIEETLFHPYFDEGIVNEIKQNYQDRIIRYLDKPANFLTERVKEVLSQDHRSFFERRSDKRDLVARTDLLKVKKAYDHLLNDAEIRIYILGNVEKGDFAQFEKWPMGKKNAASADLSPIKLSDHGYIEFQKDISQAYLRIVFDCDCDNRQPDYFKWLVTNTILGSGPSSLLFKIVREQNSLCYSVYSVVRRSEGLAEIAAASSFEHINKICLLTNEIMHDLATDGPKEDDLKVAKTYLINAIKANDDTAKNIIDHLIANDIYNTDLTLADYIELIDKVTCNDVKKIISSYRKRGTFVLRGIEDE